jgi:hypothetical protein
MFSYITGFILVSKARELWEWESLLSVITLGEQSTNSALDEEAVAIETKMITDSKSSYIKLG